MNTLLEMLSYRRPAGSVADEAFRKRFIHTLPGACEDLHRNIVVEVGEGSTTLFSCHTDTVHKDPGTQVVLADPMIGLAYKDDKEPLGADDAAGCWILVNMIKAGIPGVYVFHYGEERGGIGSSAKASKDPEFFKRFRRAVAFDRRETSDVITHQGGNRCCSEVFAAALAAALNGAESTFTYRPDHTGVFTDTANYTRLVPECTNLSVGYEHEHRAEETLDLHHVQKLCDAALKIDWEALPTERDPSVRESLYWGLEDDDDYQRLGRSYSTLGSKDYYAELDHRATEICEWYGVPEMVGFDIARYAAEIEHDLEEYKDELRELRLWRAEQMAAQAKRMTKRQRKKQRRFADRVGQASGLSLVPDVARPQQDRAREDVYDDDLTEDQPF